jgi:uncharacterized protein (DUF3820 family)
MATPITIPFGKHKGQNLDDVPDSYLIWLLKQDWVETKFSRLYNRLLELEPLLEDNSMDDY